MINKKRVFSGTRATGRLHLGNYLGAVKGYIALQEKPELECIYMVVDVHTITTPYDHRSLLKSSRGVVLDYLAAGLDPKKVIITAQSMVSEHTELAFLFSSMVSVAEMQHLPTFKEKVKQHPESVTMALLNYPVLMAADILIYKAELVPAGIDQEPHLEIARKIARRMKNRFGIDFPEPKRFSTKAEYVPSLLGEGKMSKSVEGSYINLMDDLEEIKQKLAGVPTDSGKGKISSEKYKGRLPTHEEINRYISKQDKESLGVAVLMTLVEIFQGKDKKKEYEKLYTDSEGEGIRYRELKEELAEAIYQELKPIQVKREKLSKDSSGVEKIMEEGAERARMIASKTLKEVKEKMGLSG